MSKLHRLFHLTRVTEYLPSAEPIHRGKCFGKICSYHLFLSAVDLKSKDKTVLKERKNCAPTCYGIMLPMIYVFHLFIPSSPSALAVVQLLVATTIVCPLLFICFFPDCQKRGLTSSQANGEKQTSNSVHLFFLGHLKRAK